MLVSLISSIVITHVISDFCHEVAGNCALLGYYAASSGNFLPMFQDNSSFPSSVFKNPRRAITPKWNLYREECGQ